MAVSDIHQLKGHTCSAFHGVFVTTGRAETAVTAKRDKPKFATMGTAVHGTTEGWIATVNHLFDIFHLSIPGMKSIFNFFLIVGKDSLQDIHKPIMQEKATKRKPYPLKIEGQRS